MEFWHHSVGNLQWRRQAPECSGLSKSKFIQNGGTFWFFRLLLHGVIFPSPSNCGKKVNNSTIEFILSIWFFNYRSCSFMKISISFLHLSGQNQQTLLTIAWIMNQISGLPLEPLSVILTACLPQVSTDGAISLVTVFYLCCFYQIISNFAIPSKKVFDVFQAFLFLTFV